MIQALTARLIYGLSGVVLGAVLAGAIALNYGLDQFMDGPGPYLRRPKPTEAPPAEILEKWRTKTVTVPLVVYVPEKPKQQERVEERFDLPLDDLDVLGAFRLGKSKWGSEVLVTIGKDGKTHVQEAQNRPPALSRGGRREWSLFLERGFWLSVDDEIPAQGLSLGVTLKQPVISIFGHRASAEGDAFADIERKALGFRVRIRGDRE